MAQNDWDETCPTCGSLNVSCMASLPDEEVYECDDCEEDIVVSVHKTVIKPNAKKEKALPAR